MNQSFKPTPHDFRNLAQRALAELEEAERAAEQAKRRRARIREEQVLPDLRTRYHESKLTEPLINSVLDKRAGTDPYWKSKAGANRWHLDQSRTYSLAALVAEKLNTQAKPE